MIFCREFPFSKTPETNLSRAEAFSTIYKVIPLVEVKHGGRELAKWTQSAKTDFATPKMSDAFWDDIKWADRDLRLDDELNASNPLRRNDRLHGHTQSIFTSLVYISTWCWAAIS